MRRAKKVQAVFFELRRVFGRTRPAGELLRVAAYIVAEFLGDDIDTVLASGQGSVPFYAKPVDEAFADGGWEVLVYEAKQNFVAFVDGEASQSMWSREIRWLIGRVQWPRPTEMG